MKAGALYTLFSDFTCLYCYVLHERLHSLNLIQLCEWRGVQHAPHLPSPMKPQQGSLAAELRQEVMVVQHLAPDVPIALPPGKPNTKSAIERALVLLHGGPTQAMQFVR